MKPNAAFCYSSRDSLVATADASAPRSALEAQAALSAQPQGILPERTPPGLCTNQAGGDTGNCWAELTQACAVQLSK